MSDVEKTNKLLERFVVPERLQRLEQVLDARTSSLTIVLEEIRNPHNISAVLRSADAFGLQEVHLVGKNFEYSSGISLGSERWLSLQRHETASSALAALQADGFAPVVLQPEDDIRFSTVEKLPITALPFENKLALVFGNEHKGVSQLFIEQAQYHAFIPMCGFVESLNISVACAISLFAAQLPQCPPQRRTQALGEEQRRALRAQWLQQSVRGADIILRDIDQRTQADES